MHSWQLSISGQTLRPADMVCTEVFHHGWWPPLFSQHLSNTQWQRKTSTAGTGIHLMSYSQVTPPDPERDGPTAKYCKSGLFYFGARPASDNLSLEAHERGRAILVKSCERHNSAGWKSSQMGLISNTTLFTPVSIDTFGGFFFFPSGIENDKTYSWRALLEQCDSICKRPLCLAAAAALSHTVLTKDCIAHP